MVGSAPIPGQHTAEILTTLLKYSAEEVQALEADRVVYTGAVAGQKTAAASR